MAPISPPIHTSTILSLIFLLLTSLVQPFIVYSCSSATISLPRGGSENESCEQQSPYSVISNYLQQQPPETKTKFHIQGWRWHTLSLVRDAGRLEKLAVKLLKEDTPKENLDTAAWHVIDFNMKGLHRIENELFFPWLRKKLADVGEEVGEAFERVLDDIEEDRKHISKLGLAVKEQARIASSPDVDPAKRSEATSNLAQMSAALTSRTRDIMEKEEKLLVPAVAVLVPINEQKSFNNKVIRKLGIFDSRLHLVGMHDAVWEKADVKERDLFNEAIPYIPRKMIPRWRRLLYEPQAGVLNLGN